MKRLLLLILTFCFTHALYAQIVPGVVRGTLQDSTTAASLSDATVTILKAADSSVVSFTRTSNSGFFEIKNLGIASYILTISYQGYQTLRKPFVISNATATINFGFVRLNHNYKTLDEVVARGRCRYHPRRRRDRG